MKSKFLLFIGGSVIAIAILASLCYLATDRGTNSTYSNISQNTSSITVNNSAVPDYEVITNIALNNDTVKKLLGNQKYYVNSVNVLYNTVIFDVGNATVWGHVIVHTDPSNNTTISARYVPHSVYAYMDQPVTLKDSGNATLPYNITASAITSREYVDPVISQADQWKAEGMNDTQIVDEFAKKDVIYNPVTRDWDFGHPMSGEEAELWNESLNAARSAGLPTP